MDRLHPPLSADERATLEGFLDHQRATLLMKAEGLDRAQLNQRLPTSELTLAGLLKHLALVEDDWITGSLLRPTGARAVGQRAMGAGPGLGLPHRRARRSRCSARALPGRLRAK